MTFYGKDISGLHADLVAKKVSATELTKAAFDRIKATDDQVGAFLALNEEAALKQAAGFQDLGKLQARLRCHGR